MTALQHDWREQFEIFVARKTRLAMALPFPPYLTELDNPAQDAFAVGNAWTNRLFDGPFYLSPAANPSRPACSLVFVQSSDGNTCAADPGLLGGGNTDTHLIYEGLSRVAVDAVLAGAETVRRSEVVFSVWHPKLVDFGCRWGSRATRFKSLPPFAVSSSMIRCCSIFLTSPCSC